MNKLLLLMILFLLTGCFEKQNSEATFYGNVDVRTVSLSFQVSGKIAHINYDEGAKVKKGDLLATLDASMYKVRLQQADALIDAKKAQIKKLESGYRAEEIAQAKEKLQQQTILLENAKRTFLRYKGLLATKSVSQNKYDNMNTTYKNAKAMVQIARSNLELLQKGYRKEDIVAAKAQLQALKFQADTDKINLARTDLYAPYDGIILTRVHEVGAVVNGSQTVIEMAKTDQYWVRAYMSEKYLGVIKTGMKAIISTDNGKIYQGRVGFISPIAEFTPKTVQTQELRTQLVYRFRVILDTRDKNIDQGMPVTVKFPDIKTR